jgi:uracil-DNA glycosylase family 4
MTSVTDCRYCKRLTAYRKLIQQEYPDYYCRPVDAFGDDKVQLLIVGLAPGMHGANASGRVFTGDASGDLLFETLYKFGFASQKRSISADDGMTLESCRITNAVKCLPPQNKPSAQEINQCNQFLRREIKSLQEDSIILALGAIAHKAVVKSFDLAQKSFPFAHHAKHQLPDDMTLIDSYHCSRYNTQTGRLTVDMFEQVFADIRIRLDHG